jgi:HAD superfamily hydrolase (TIGR01509 family)
MIKAICTDFGGVLFPSQPYKSKPDNAKFSLIKSIVIDIYKKNELSITSKQYTLATFKQDLLAVKSALPQEELIQIYESIANIDNEYLNLLHILKSRLAIYGLVNEAPKWTELRVYLHSLASIFDDVFISAYINTQKPEISAYDYMLKNTRLLPDEILFIDDSYENIRVAQELGFKTILHSNFSTTAKEIEDMNKVYLFFGPPSSGKSYLGKRFAELKGFTFYEADDDYIPEYRERVKVSDVEKQRVYDEFYSIVINKTRILLKQNKPVVIASAMGKNINRKRFFDEFGDTVVFVLVKSKPEILIENAIKREFPKLEGRVLTKEKEESLRNHLINKLQKFEEPNFPHITILNDYSDSVVTKLSDIL